jgi:ferredoxin/flavodoxin
LTKIYYFSGTGNTLWSAKKIAEIMGNCELLNIGVEAYKDEIVVEADAVVLLFPSYAYGLPLIVRNFVKNAVFKTAYLAAFVTFGTSPGGTMAALNRLLKRKKINAFYFGQIPAVENYIALFGSPKPIITEKRLTMQVEATETAARCIMERRTNRVNPFRPFSVFIWSLFFLGANIFYRFYRISAECNGCGICEKVCPVSAITLRNGKPAFSARCQHCNGCLNWCPRRAINFGRLHSGLARYHHPEITVANITR